MIVTLVVELEDKPGQLLRVIEPISQLGGNIISIVHDRNKITPLNRVPVEFTLDIAPKRLEELIERLKQNEIYIRSYNEIKLSASTSLLLIGHIIHTDLSDTVNRIDSTGFAEVVEINISMPHLNRPSTAIITISAKSERHLKEAVKILEDYSELFGYEIAGLITVKNGTVKLTKEGLEAVINEWIPEIKDKLTELRELDPEAYKSYYLNSVKI